MTGFSMPLPSTHSHHHKQHSHSLSVDRSASPGHLPHASTSPAVLDAHNHKHYHNRDTHHTDMNPLSHIPNVNPVTYLSKHHQEYDTQHAFRHAKRDASMSSDTHPMPSLEYSSPTSTSLTSSHSHALSEEPSNITLSPTQQAELEEQRRKHREEDNAAWAAILKSREAAARRSTIDKDTIERPHIEEYQKMSEGSVRTANSRD